MLENAAESPASSARFVRCVRIVQDLLPKNRTQPFNDLILPVTKFLAMLIWQKPKLCQKK